MDVLLMRFLTITILPLYITIDEKSTSIAVAQKKNEKQSFHWSSESLLNFVRIHIIFL